MFAAKGVRNTRHPLWRRRQPEGQTSARIKAVYRRVEIYTKRISKAKETGKALLAPVEGEEPTILLLQIKRKLERERAIPTTTTATMDRTTTTLVVGGKGRTSAPIRSILSSLSLTSQTMSVRPTEEKQNNICHQPLINQSEAMLRNRSLLM